MKVHWGLSVLTALASAAFAGENGVRSTSSPSAEIEFFETSVRPLLLSACAGCHGEKKQWGGLRVDSRAALLKGGETNPAVVPGRLDESLLISAIRRTGDYEMPPEKPLNAGQIAILERWVQMGAPWSDEIVVDDRLQRQRNHWAFQPVSKPVPPVVARQAWCQTPIDAFVLAKLDEAHLAPAPAADRRVLIRRMTYGLTGLPPTPEEVEAFIHDPAPDASSKLVDRLLNSPEYGEHWARHWLDLARYSDTKGYMFSWEPGNFVHSSTYRDWVVNAFRSDLPYDQFLLLQLAADQAAPDEPAAQAAMGFLTLGRRFLGNDHDIIDDRIDVVGRTTMGLTFGCARCHDHKYDPIPTADYYSLYGVFGNSVEELVPASPASDGEPSSFDKELQNRIARFQEEFQKYRGIIANRMRDRITDYLIAQLALDQHPNIPFSQILAKEDLFPVYVHRWDAFLRRSRINHDPVFVPWHLYAALSEQEFPSRAVEVSRQIQESAPQEILPTVAAMFEVPPASIQEVAQRYGALFSEVHQEWQTLLSEAGNSGEAPPEGFSAPEREVLRKVLYGPESPCLVPDESLAGVGTYFATRTELEEIWQLQKPVEQWILNSPNALPFAVRMIDRKIVEEPRIFRRGNPVTQGDEVPRWLPLVVAGEARQPFTIGSGRLELARGIISPDNPLTARVWVNRIWQHHFGTGLVPTSSDFGTRAPKPEHLELLDWLARKLIEEHWSTKSIQRLILLSSTYQQQSTGPDELTVRLLSQERDPENRLYWKMNRHRLTFEEFRDSMLKDSEELDQTIGGRGSPLFPETGVNRRRTLYGLIDRQSLPNACRMFDFANPDLHIAVRSETTVSQQALFAMNHPFVAGRAFEVASQLESRTDASPSQRLHELYLRIYQRPPTARQMERGLHFLETAEVQLEPGMLTPWQQLVQVLLLSNEFLFVD